MLLYTQTRTYQAESKSFVVDNILECVTIEFTMKNHTNVVVSCFYRPLRSRIDTFCKKHRT